LIIFEKNCYNAQKLLFNTWETLFFIGDYFTEAVQITKEQFTFLKLFHLIKVPSLKPQGSAGQII